MYGNDRCYINSILTNPYVAAKGLGSIAYRRLENFVVQKFNVKRIFLTPLRPHDYVTKGVTNTLTPYWRDKMGFSWPDEAYLRKLNPTPALRTMKDKNGQMVRRNDNNNEPGERYNVGSVDRVDPEQPYWAEDQSRNLVWQSHSMWKTAQTYPVELTTSTNEGFNQECDFNKTVLPNVTFMVVDLSHETKIAYRDTDQSWDAKLTAAMPLLDHSPPAPTPPPVAQAPSSPVSSVESPVVTSPSVDLKMDLKPQPKVTQPRRSQRLINRKKAKKRPRFVIRGNLQPPIDAMTKKKGITATKNILKQQKRPRYILRGTVNPTAAHDSVNETAVKKTPVTDAEPTKKAKQGKYVGTYPPMIIDSDEDTT